MKCSKKIIILTFLLFICIYFNYKINGTSCFKSVVYTYVVQKATNIEYLMTFVCEITKNNQYIMFIIDAALTRIKQVAIINCNIIR